MRVDQTAVHRFTDLLVTAYWRSRSYRACLRCTARAVLEAVRSGAARRQHVGRAGGR